MQPYIQSRANFDRIARPYRWLEYLTMGSTLSNCRQALLPQMGCPKRALIIGDGDGRFLSTFLSVCPDLKADVVDMSSAMLNLSRQRVKRLPDSRDVHFYCADVSHGLPVPDSHRYDAVVTHFFLDCLTNTQVTVLMEAVAPRLTPSASWLISEFAVPSQGIASVVARLMIPSLYFAFRCITGLRVKRLPNYAEGFRKCGFHCQERREFLGGILRSELWRSAP